MAPPGFLAGSPAPPPTASIRPSGEGAGGCRQERGDGSRGYGGIEAMHIRPLTWISFGAMAVLCAGCGRVPSPEAAVGTARSGPPEEAPEPIKFLPKPTPLPRLERVEAAIRNVRERD